MRALSILPLACALLTATACTCRAPQRAVASDAGAPTAAPSDASTFGCVDAETHLVHTVGVVEATLGACDRDADCVGNDLLVDCPRATFVTCGFAYAEDHADEARARIDRAVDTACARLDEPCDVRTLDGPDCPSSTVRCVDGRCRAFVTSDGVTASPR